MHARIVECGPWRLESVNWSVHVRIVETGECPWFPSAMCVGIPSVLPNEHRDLPHVNPGNGVRTLKSPGGVATLGFATPATK